MEDEAERRESGDVHALVGHPLLTRLQKCSLQRPLLDVLSGRNSPIHGEIRGNGQSQVRHDPWHEMSSLGVWRTSQNPTGTLCGADWRGLFRVLLRCSRGHSPDPAGVRCLSATGQFLLPASPTDPRYPRLL